MNYKKYQIDIENDIIKLTHNSLFNNVVRGR